MIIDPVEELKRCAGERMRHAKARGGQETRLRCKPTDGRKASLVRRLRSVPLDALWPAGHQLISAQSHHPLEP